MSDNEVEQQPLWTRDARPWRRRSCWWHSGGHCDMNAAVVLLAMVMTASLVEIQAVDLYSDLIVVNIEATGKKLRQKSCPIMCSGTMLTPIMVLTAASCTLTEETTNNWSTTNTSSTPSDVFTTEIEYTTIKIITKVEKGDITVYVNQPTNDDANYRYVTDKYLHPLWNATTRVADLALLKLESKFPNYETVKMPLILNNQLSKMQMVAFKGFGKINNDGQSVLSTDNSLTEQNMLRYLIVEQWDINGTSCFSSREDAPSMWSFLCSTPENVHTIIQNTLCLNDVGGPLFSMDREKESEKLRLYAIFSHVHHWMSPICATHICNILSKAPFPCRNLTDMFYKHTALLGRFGEWVKLTIEQATLISTDGPTRNCPTERTTTITQSTTLDPEYDVDAYSDQRFMVANQKVCSKKSSSSACVLPLAGVILIACAIVGLVLTATQN